MKWRANRFPSAWSVDVSADQGRYRINLVNVSSTGLRYREDLPLAAGDTVFFTILGQRINAKIVRQLDTGGAMQFDRELTPTHLSILRQSRAVSVAW